MPSWAGGAVESDGAGRVVSISGDAAYTTNGGATWTNSTTSPTDPFGYNDLVYDGILTWAAVGDYNYSPYGGATYSTDGGVNWSGASVAGWDGAAWNNRLFCITYDSVSGRFIAGGSSASIVYSTDGGYSWKTAYEIVYTTVRINGIAAGKAWNN